MKKTQNTLYLMLVSFFLLTITACKQNEKSTKTTSVEQFSLNGIATGVEDGTKVELRATSSVPRYIWKMKTNEHPPALATTEVKNGAFEFKDTLITEGMHLVIFHTKERKYEKPEGYDKEVTKDLLPAAYVFLENKPMTLTVDVDKLPNEEAWEFMAMWDYKEVQLVGSKSHEILDQHVKDIAPLMAKMMAFFEGGSPSDDPEDLTYESAEKSVAAVSEREAVANEMNQLRKDLLKQHIDTPLGVYLASQWAIGEEGILSQADMKELLAKLSDATKNTEAGKKLVEQLNKQSTVALGAKVMDKELYDPQGNKVKLSEHLGKGKYVLLDFWASWCFPCRAEIPHLKKVYKHYEKEGFEILSVSIDKNKEDWLKALKKEQMPWTQLSLSKTKEEQKAMTKEEKEQWDYWEGAYQITGVPTCWLIDPEGKIVRHRFRMDVVDAHLVKLYGNKFE